LLTVGKYFGGRSYDGAIYQCCSNRIGPAVGQGGVIIIRSLLVGKCLDL
jgi:hypothetical protein